MKRTIIASLALTAFGLFGCNESAESGDVCTAINSFTFNDGTVCVVIEEGFLAVDCPDDLPEGEGFDEFVLCSDQPVTSETEAEARRRGYGTAICEDGDTRTADDGCNTCQCSDGAWACTEIGCFPTFDQCLAACEQCESPSDDGARYVAESPETCAVIDYACDDGEVGFSNECGCGCKPAAASCQDGDTRTEDCNDCVCESGEWVCDTRECPTEFEQCIATCDDCLSPDAPDVLYVGESTADCEVIDFACEAGQEPFANACGCGCVGPEPACEEGATRVDGCNDCVCNDGVWLCDDRECSELELCLEACGVGCPEPAFQFCAEDGEYYCGECQLDCYGLSLAPTRETCDCTPPNGQRQDPMYFELPEGCVDVQGGFGDFLVAFGPDDLIGQIDCLEGTDLGFDFGGFVFIRVVFPENPNAELEGIYRDIDADTWTASWTAAAYCGGPAPETQVRYLMASFGDETQYTQSQCTYDVCTEFFP